MDIQAITQALAAKFHIEGLECRDNKIDMEIDGAAVRIETDEDGGFLLRGWVGMAPVEGAEAFGNILLEANETLMESRKAALARNPETGAYELLERLPVAPDVESFCQGLEQFANSLESWRTLLKEFGPAATHAAAATAEDNAATLEALRNNMLRL